MSMIARFVAITSDQLATIKDTPEMVGGVFALDAGLPSESPFDLQERVRRQATLDWVIEARASKPISVSSRVYLVLANTPSALPTKSGANLSLKPDRKPIAHNEE
jgi:hypothetical protein